MYSGPNETGTSLLTGLGHADRYAQIPSSALASHSLVNDVASGSLSSTEADLNLICFSNTDYTGSFFQISLPREDSSETFWHAGPAQSALLIASRNAGAKEHRVSLVDTLRSDWDSFLDGKLQGTSVSRDVEPLLTWQMFPANNPWLSSKQIYIRIHQPLHVHMPWYWPDYQASMDYNVVLYVNDNQQLRAWVADCESWVEGGAKNGQVHNQLDPQIQAGMQPLQDKLNEKLALTDLLGAIKDVFLLPGRQPNPIGAAVLGGNTADDITICVQS
jgi:hypothetical protein